MTKENAEAQTIAELQQELPITIAADSRFSSSLKPLLTELEMWLNFQALKADWYGDEEFVLNFDFTLIRSLDEKMQQLEAAGASCNTSNGSAAAWNIEKGYAYHYESSNLMTTAFIAVDDLLEAGVGIEQGIKDRLTAVANSVASEHGLLGLV
ncbi:hypothetical protein [uncultured Shewanella sp.]|uniref:hypothetical protein n=1 Tax=Shewanella atlantica TaxID=271099 RepID=UPI00262107B0|nr:hypothetical protein [uncultured Shewanella sp.]